MSLSTASIRFLRYLSRNQRVSEHNENIGQAYTQLLCELYDIMREVKSALEAQNIGPWTLTYNGTGQLDFLSFAYTFSSSHGPYSINLDININPLGASSLSLTTDLPSSEIDPIIWDKYSSSPAYKRYFAEHSDGQQYLYTELPSRQLSSRHFTSYLIHLCGMLAPYLRHLTAQKGELVLI